MVAVKLSGAPSGTFEVVGVTVTSMGMIEILTGTDLDESSTDVAVITTVPPEGIEPGAV
jgi:hypothetical protein